MMKKFFICCIGVILCVDLMAQDEDLCKNYKLRFDDWMKEELWNKLADSAKLLEDHSVVYDPSYVKIPYPNGDVPAGTGVCTDVVIRAFRKGLNHDLQEQVHEYLKYTHPDMLLDKNIDHRRVRNIMEYLDAWLDIAQLYNMHKDKYLKGNVIIWDLGGGQLHIGICVADDMIIHNICCGQVIEPIANVYGKIIRNYNFRPDFLGELVGKCEEQGLIK